jgi:acyl dehydratase
MARRSFDSVGVGDVVAERTFAIRRADLVRYAGASGDFNPIHWNERVATSAGMPDVISHGMLTMAMVGRLVSDWAGDPGAVVEYGSRFTKPVVVPDDEAGASLVVSGVVATKDGQARTVRVDLTATSGGQKVLVRAQAVVRLT